MAPRRGLPSNILAPTAHQIGNNLVVIPKGFIETAGLPRSGFDVVFMGEALGSRRFDSENRIPLPLRNRVQLGQHLRLRVVDQRLYIDTDGD